MLSLKRALVARPTASDSFILDDDIFYFCFIKKNCFNAKFGCYGRIVLQTKTQYLVAIYM